MRFNQLIDIINETHSTLQQKAASAVNQGLTIRNWLIGFYIAEFEQNGEDRAKYGDRLLEKIAESTINIRGLSLRNLKLCRQFYARYRQIGQTVSAQLQMSDFEKLRTVFTQSAFSVPQIGQTLSAQSKVTSDRESIGVNPRELINRLSFSQFVELIGIDDPLKRAFYEIECIKGNWSIRELKRQIRSLYFERSGLSRDKAKLSAYTQKKLRPCSRKM
jgi:hypothetical protein